MFSSFSSCREWILECSRLLNLWSTHAFLFFPTGLDVCRWGVGGLLRDIDPVGMVIGPDGCEVKVTSIEGVHKEVGVFLEEVISA